MNNTRRIMWLGLLAIVLGLSSVNCGWNHPPRLWQCDCKLRCANDPGLSRTYTQQACGYTQKEAQRNANYRSRSAPLVGCASVTSSCVNCMISRKYYCRQHVVTAGTTLIDDDYWEPDDTIVVTEEFVDPDDPQYQDNQGNYTDPDPGNPDPSDDPEDPGSSDPPDEP